MPDQHPTEPLPRRKLVLRIPNRYRGEPLLVIDPFVPIHCFPPGAHIPPKERHPVPLNDLMDKRPLQTNKFYANLFLGKQTNPVWTDPYSVSWSAGGGNAKSWGLAISHVDANQRAFGDPSPSIPGNPAAFFINPLGIQSLIFSSGELDKSTRLTTNHLGLFSVEATLISSTCMASIEFPLVQGMAFVTAIYRGSTPLIQSGVGFLYFSTERSPRPGVYKYRIFTEDQKCWFMYVSPNRSTVDPSFTLHDGVLKGPSAPWSGTIQIAKNPAGAEGEAIYDAAAGAFPTAGTLEGRVTGCLGSYTLNWTMSIANDSIANDPSPAPKLLMFALDHHLHSFDETTARGITELTLATTTAGNATAVIGGSWTLVEPSLPISMGFAPWSPTAGSADSLSPQAISAIQAVAEEEVGQDMHAQTNLDSFYFAGKALFKFAQMVWVLKNLAHSPDLAAIGLAKLKSAFEIWVSNKNKFPLVYDTTWGGAVSSAWADSGADFGNSFYNDHHFHYGYFIAAAAIVGSMDSDWLAANKNYINIMARDVSNPSASDPWFPVFRSFDWYHGHSWAKGLFESGDGKDEESSSEDMMYAYSLKMWGKTLGNESIEALGNLMLSVLARSVKMYMLMTKSNKVQPPNYIGNKVVGITFQNKLDHTTYFGSNIEYIHGIHMLPLIPATTLARTKQFVREEWDTYFARNAVNPASSVVGGWKGILYANRAIINPKASFRFFSKPNFNPSYLDGGGSRTWYLAFADGLMDY